MEFKKEIGRIKSEISHQEQRSAKSLADTQEKKAAYENSSEFYSKKLCETANYIKLAKTVIARENEAGSISGYVDKKKIYEAGLILFHIYASIFFPLTMSFSTSVSEAG